MKQATITGLLPATMLLATMLAAPARAEMKDYQLRRLLNFRTDCQMEGFDDRSAPDGPGLFHAVCGNVTFYPDGVDLECPDRVDEWSCRILTKPKSFDSLDLLGQKKGAD